jgi:hypothetical protein
LSVRAVTLAGHLAPTVIFPSVARAVRFEGISSRNRPSARLQTATVGLALARAVLLLRGMYQKTWELQERTRRFSQAVSDLCGDLPSDRGVRKVARRVSAASTAVDIGYRAACVSQSADQFIVHMSAVARNARRARTLLQDMVRANQVPIEAARELILGARGLEAIFVASRNTARRRKAARDRRAQK